MKLYEVLGVAFDASADEIKAAYRRLAIQRHPDRGGTAEAMAELNEAYEVLKDPERRQHYNETSQTHLVPPLDKEAMDVILYFFNAMLQDHRSEDINNIDGMRRIIVAEMDEKRKALATGLKELQFLDRRSKRIRARDGRTNYLAAAIAQRRDQVESLRADGGARLARLERALELLDDFTDDFVEGGWAPGVGGLCDRPDRSVVIGLPNMDVWRDS